MITLHWLYALAGAMFAAFALLSAVDRSNKKRFGNAAFWGLMALSLLGGDFIGDFGNGLLVLGLAGLAGFGFLGRSHPPTTSDEERADFSIRLGNKLFLPALIIPATALIGTLGLQLHACRTVRLDRDQARDLRLPLPRSRCSRSARSMSGFARRP